MAEFFPRLFPSTSLEELYTFLALNKDGVKNGDDVDEQSGGKGDEQPASVPDSVVNLVNEEGSIKSNTLQMLEGTRSAHVILADLSPCKSIHLHLFKVTTSSQMQCMLVDPFRSSFCCCACHNVWMKCTPCEL